MQVETKSSRTETEKLFALDKPSLENLSYVLRHPDMWPEGFIWNFNHCDSCAMGLAHSLWSAIPSTNRDTGSSIMARSFAMPHEDANLIFMSARGKKKILGFIPSTPYNRDVTPEMVADQIDKYLATVK